MRFWKMIALCVFCIQIFAACSAWRIEKKIALDFIDDAPKAVFRHSDALALSPEVLTDLTSKSGHFARRMDSFGKDFRIGAYDDKDTDGKIHLSIYVQNSKPETVEFQFLGIEGKMKLTSIILHKF